MTFFMKDPYGNIFQLVEANDWFRDEKKNTGGSYGAVIGVSDIEKSRVVYSDILGYDDVIYDTTGFFPDLAGLPGGNNECRRVLLKDLNHFPELSVRFSVKVLLNLSVPPGIPEKDL